MFFFLEVWFLPPANEVCEGYVFTGVCLSTQGGTCVVLFGGGMHGFIGGRAWFYSGGMHGFIRGGMRGFIRGLCMVLFGGHAWFYSRGRVWFYSRGGMHGFIRGGMRGFIWGGMRGFPGGMRGFFSFFRYNEIRSMSGRYASYWNAFLYNITLYLAGHVKLCYIEVITRNSERQRRCETSRRFDSKRQKCNHKDRAIGWNCHRH